MKKKMTLQELAEFYEIDLSREQDILIEDIQYLIDNSEDKERTRDLKSILKQVLAMPPSQEEPTHTPGEWHAKEGQIYPLETGKTLALIPYYDPENKEQQANAKLIAAAPELLEALKNLLDVNSEIDIDTYYLRPDFIEDLKTAKAKAREAIEKSK